MQSRYKKFSAHLSLENNAAEGTPVVAGLDYSLRL